ncbi:MAG TPA: GNAT family N-acetyltransferase [Candidatus Binataceae bacterium]|nr:GNAT family N-acetyltransferase [Candidatus Binataceae bacterium]
MRFADIRCYESKDAAFLGAVFFAAVRTAGLRDYSQAQVEAWAPAMPDSASFEARAKDGRLILVAVNEADEPIAYGDLKLNGHIDHLYCHPEIIGAGVASALYDRLEQQARARGITRLFVEASEAARRLFFRKGFAQVKRRDFILRGVSIHNYLMEKFFIAPEP